MPAPNPNEWLHKPIQVIRASDRDVINALLTARRDVDAQLAEIERRFSGKIGEAVRRQQLLMVKRNLQLEEARVWRSIGDRTTARRLEAISRVVSLYEQLDKHLLVDVAKMGGLGNQIARAIALSERDNAERAIDRMITRLNGDSYIPLSQRVYNSAVHLGGQIDRMVNSALARGLSAKEFAREARDFINPHTPGGMRYAALRLARTEINNAAHAVSVNAVQEKPWIEAMKWNLSGSHPKPDACDQLARGGKKGDGVYPKDEVPAKPHPQCFCFVTPETPGDDEFLDNLLGGKYNDYLNKYNASRGRGTFDTSILPQKPSPLKPSIAKTTAKPSLPKAATPPAPKVKHPKLDTVERIDRGAMQTQRGRIIADGWGTNPHYTPGSLYSVNCTNCSNVFELRARGYNLTAAPMPTMHGRQAQIILDQWRLPSGDPHGRRIAWIYNFDTVEAIVKLWPDGARGWVQVAWKNGGAHIFNVEKVDGQIVWVEGQSVQSSGKVYADIDRYKQQADPAAGSWGLVRMDDLEPTDGVLQFTDAP